jgi:hypothetical protein
MSDTEESESKKKSSAFCDYSQRFLADVWDGLFYCSCFVFLISIATLISSIPDGSTARTDVGGYGFIFSGTILLLKWLSIHSKSVRKKYSENRLFQESLGSGGGAREQKPADLQVNRSQRHGEETAFLGTIRPTKKNAELATSARAKAESDLPETYKAPTKPEVRFPTNRKEQRRVPRSHETTTQTDLSHLKSSILDRAASSTLSYPQVCSIIDQKHRYGFTSDELKIIEESQVPTHWRPEPEVARGPTKQGNGKGTAFGGAGRVIQPRAPLYPEESDSGDSQASWSQTPQADLTHLKGRVLAQAEHGLLNDKQKAKLLGRKERFGFTVEELQCLSACETLKVTEPEFRPKSLDLQRTRGNPGCPRCGGTGYIAKFQHIENGRCFACKKY